MYLLVATERILLQNLKLKVISMTRYPFQFSVIGILYRKEKNIFVNIITAAILTLISK